MYQGRDMDNLFLNRGPGVKELVVSWQAVPAAVLL